MISLSIQRRIASAVIVIAAVASVISIAWVARYGWAIHQLTRGVGDTVFESADGKPWFRMDEQRRDVRLDQIAPALRHAVIAVEDHRFYHHFGIDPIALGRAVLRNARDREVEQGGSTLTQQLARTLFLSNRRTWGRKIREAGLALMLETELSKDQILELYLNRVYLSAGTYGAETMSRYLFGKPARDLTIAESALIAGLIRAPSALSPWSNLDGAIRRSHVVLQRMREEGFITPAEEARARAARLAIRPYPVIQSARGGYAKDYLRQQFRNHFGGDHPPEWRVETTIDPELQDMAERAVQAGLRRTGRADLQAALVAIDPATGGVVALVGGRDYSKSTFDRATRSHRQPGSAFKPFLYAVALGNGYSPVSVLQGLSAIPPQGPDEWSPRNARQEENADALTLRAALLESDNRAATALQQKVGGRPVVRLASDLGMGDLPNVPSLALGTGEVTPLDLTAAYATFVNGGYVVRPHGISRVLDADNDVAFEQEVGGGRRDRVLEPTVAYQMVSMLRDVVERGTGSSARSLGIYFPAGGKTGTTDNFRDAWFVGFSSAIVAGVWVGFDQPAEIGPNAYGARVALPIWAEFMRHAARKYPPRDFERPAGLHEEELCSVSYLRPVEACPTYIEYFKEGDEIPSKLCPIHQGTLKQRAHRALQNVLSELGRAIRGIFK